MDIGLGGGISKLAVPALPRRSLLVDSSSYRQQGDIEREDIKNRPSQKPQKSVLDREEYNRGNVPGTFGRFVLTWTYSKVRTRGQRDGEGTAGFIGDRRRRLGENAADSQPLCAQRGLFHHRATTGKLFNTCDIHDTISSLFIHWRIYNVVCFNQLRCWC